MKYIQIISISIFIATTNPTYAKEGLSMLQIFDQFVTSSAAASRCIKSDDESLTKFLASFQMISVYTSLELAKKYPKYTKEQIARAMKIKAKLITQKVFEMVREKGCDDPDIKQVTKRFRVQAKWKPGE